MTCCPRGSPPASTMARTASNSAVIATPLSSSRSGTKPLRRLSRTSTARLASAPRVPAPTRVRLPGAGSRKMAAISAMALPPLMPSTSGLAMGLAVTRWIRVPAMASITPLAAAASKRGQRHASIVSSGVANQPPAPWPISSASRMAAASTSVRPEARRPGAGWREARAAAEAGGRLASRRSRGISHSSSGAPRAAVVAPVGIRVGRLPAKRCSSRSVVASSRAPSSVDQRSRAPRRRAPARRTILGAARPMKPITPTTLTTQPVRKTASPNPARRRCFSETPRLRALASSSSSTVSGRSSSQAARPPSSSRGARNTTSCQPFWASEPAPQISSPLRVSWWKSSSTMPSAPQ